jgi:hypothetical protein
LGVMRHVVLGSHGRSACGYDVDASLMQSGVRGCGIHALSQGAPDAEIPGGVYVARGGRYRGPEVIGRRGC